MAGDWIPYCKDLPRKPEVLRIAAATDRSRGEVVYLLLEFWAWVDEQTEDGVLRRLSVSALANLHHHHGLTFFSALVDVGWLVQSADSIVIPNFERWMGRSAKRRLKQALYSKNYRHNRNGVSKSVITASSLRADEPSVCVTATVQNRTEQLEDPPTPTGGVAPSEFSAAWNAVPSFVQARSIAGKRLRHLQARARDSVWASSWREALAKAAALPFCQGRNDRGWRATVDWFLRPDTVTKILEGAYDGLGGKGPPPKPTESIESRAARIAAERKRREQEAAEAAASRAARKE